MSYQPLDSLQAIRELLSRKEYYSLRADPARNYRDPPEAHNDPMSGKHLKIQSHQLFARNMVNPNTPYMRIHLTHGTGTGKCHGKGTLVLMYDGSLRAVEHIRVGDLLMGDDSEPREVLGIARGRDRMFKVIPESREHFVCNSEHILCLRMRADTHARVVSDPDDIPTARKPRDHMIVNVSIIDYLNWPHTLRSRMRLWAVGVDLPNDPWSERRERLLRRLDQSGRMCVEHHSREQCVYLCRSLGLNAVVVDTDDTHVVLEVSTQPDIMFEMEELPPDDYYGFTLSHNHLYLLSNFIVTHNTLAGISIVMEFIRVYSKMYAAVAAKTQAGRRNYAELDKATPSVFVLGFGGTKKAFMRDLLKYPEFGFISTVERQELLKREQQAAGGLPDDIKYAKDYKTWLRKRITNKARGGFIRFYGYDEFVNRLFSSDTIKLTELEAQAIASARTATNDAPAKTLEDLVRDHIGSGDIQVNHQLINSFENSLLLCDEIHNTYNMNMRNNRGVAIQYLLDTVKSLRFVSLSATPINNSPTEVVELVNYLVPADQKITKRDIFVNSRELQPGALARLGELTSGRVSFLQDSNVKYFPKQTFIGEPIVLSSAIETFQAGQELPYLRFTPCPMSEFHQRTYERFVASALHEPPIPDSTEPDLAELDEEHPRHGIPTDGYALYDIAFPNPASDQYGIFRASEVRNSIASAAQDWRDRNQIGLKKVSATNTAIVGDFLSRDSICKYSTKYHQLLMILDQIVESAQGNLELTKKTMIYHNRVKMSGLLLIQELLRTDGYLDETSEPVEFTRCVCGVRMGEHQSAQFAHEFTPARFVTAHSDIDKATMDQSLARYNSRDNAHGHKYMILIGSKIIKESYEISDTQEMIIVSMPVSIPTLIQVFGRCNRKNSHMGLPPEQRIVNVRILITTVNLSHRHTDTISPEVRRYADKLADYLVVQSIEREINRNAVDAPIHRDIVMSEDLRGRYFPPGHTKPVDILGNLYFEPAIDLPMLAPEQINVSTWTAYKYHTEEINTITYVIKRLFLREAVWKYADLWEAVKAPPVGLEVNPKLFSESNFIIALSALSGFVKPIISASGKNVELTEPLLIEKLFNPADKYIYKHTQRYKIERVGEYYVLFPIRELETNPLNRVHAEYTEYVRDKERAMIKDLVEPDERAVADIESYSRGVVISAGVRISTREYIKSARASINYSSARQKFIEEYGDSEDVFGFLYDWSEHFQVAFVEEAIIALVTSAQGKKPPGDAPMGLYARVLDVLGKFDAIVRVDELRKYKDTTKQFKDGIPDIPKNTPMGFMTARTIRVYDPASSWFEVSKLSLNRHVTYKENETIVGYLETAADHMKFKLRKPTQKIREVIQKDALMRKIVKSEHGSATTRTVAADTRLVERGMVCATKNKHELLQILANLGVSVSRLGRSDIRIKRLCEIIKQKLVDKEIAERARRGRYKYLYGWWDEPVNITSLV